MSHFTDEKMDPESFSHSPEILQSQALSSFILLSLTKLEFVSPARFQKLHASFPAENVPVGPISFESIPPKPIWEPTGPHGRRQVPHGLPQSTWATPGPCPSPSVCMEPDWWGQRRDRGWTRGGGGREIVGFSGGAKKDAKGQSHQILMANTTHCDGRTSGRGLEDGRCCIKERLVCRIFCRIYTLSLLHLLWEAECGWKKNKIPILQLGLSSLLISQSFYKSI